MSRGRGMAASRRSASTSDMASETASPYRGGQRVTPRVAIKASIAARSESRSTGVIYTALMWFGKRTSVGGDVGGGYRKSSM
jgi:hypothetical protein